MSDLISRQSAIAYAISGRTREVEGEKWIRVSEVRESLQTMPSAQPEDAEPVVMCKDGKYYEETDSRIGTCLLTTSGAQVDGFCSWGEKR